MSLRAPCFVVPLCALLLGCGGEHDAFEKQLGDLRAEVTKLRASNAQLGERIDNIELSRGVFRGGAGQAPPPDAPDAPAAPKASGDRPVLDVVRLQPEPDASDDPDSDTPRPVVRAVGNGGSVQSGSKGKNAGSAAAQEELDKALDLHKAKSWDKASDAFTGFLAHYPESPAVELASFLRAECSAGKGDHRKAAEQFEAVAASFPQGAKAADALLRAAQAYGRAGDKASADAAKKKLVSNYPASDAARKAARLPSDKKKP